MTEFSRVVIDPSNGELADVLAEAVRWASQTFEVSYPHWRKTVRQLRASTQRAGVAEGFVTDPISDQVDPASPVAIAWWSDSHGRRHVRVMAGGLGDFGWDAKIPPLFYVYPDRLCLRTRGSGQPEVIAMCGCGVCGRTADLAWTGLRCGPCADYREERIAANLAFDESPLVFQHGRELFDLVFSPDGRMLVGSDGRWEVDAWDVRTGGPAWRNPSKLRARVAFAPCGEWFASFDTNGRHVVVDSATGRIRSRLGTETDRPPFVAVSPDGSLLAVTDPLGFHLVRLSGEPVRSYSEILPGSAAESVQFTPDGRRIIFTGGGSVAMTTFPAIAGDVGWLAECRGMPAISADGRMLAVPTESGVALLDVETGRGLATLPAGPRVNGVAFHPRLRHLVTTNAIGDVVVWSLTNHQRHTTFLAQPQGITAMALSPDGRTLATAARDGTVRLWPWEELLLV